MKIAVIGSGYVGVCTAVGFALKGNDVICVDVDESKVRQISQGKCPIFEPGLQDALSKVVLSKQLSATTDVNSAVMHSDIVFVCVGTPSKPSGEIDLTYVRHASSDIGRALALSHSYKAIVVKSTVVPGTAECVVIPEIEKASGKSAGKDFGVCSNPEFLREGRALEDVLNPDRIIIGCIDKRVGDLLESLYKSFNSVIVRTDLKTAEMIKYAANAFLATKISFINEIGNVCKKIGVDVYKVAEGIGLDRRIGKHFLRAGCGFGGSCFPKDVSALSSKAKELGCETKVLDAVLDVNNKQKTKIVDILRDRIGELKGKKVSVLGLAFNPNTDDVREGPAIYVIEKLLKEGASVVAYDPSGMENAKKVFPNITYCSNAKTALIGADACLIMTDWSEFANLHDKDFASMKSKVIIEGRRTLDREKVSDFEGVCW